MAILDDVKVVLRISHNKLNSEIESRIAEAQADLVRVGVDSAKVSAATDALVSGAIKTYCRMKFTDDLKEIEGLEKSYMTQVEALRRSSGYMRNRDAE